MDLHKPYFTSIHVVLTFQLELLIDLIQSACAGSVEALFLDLY